MFRLTSFFPDIKQSEFVYGVIGFFGGVAGFVFEGKIGFVVGLIICYCVSKILGEVFGEWGFRF